MKLITIGIDAANIRRGGGLTHLIELLESSRPLDLGIDRVVVWGGRHTLNALDDRSWLDKRNPSALNAGLLQRTLWQCFCLSQAARDAGCDVLFVPGGSYVGNFHPVVSMSQNLLPFEFGELKRYNWSFMTIKLLLLRLIQSFSYRNVDGLIFLTEYAHLVVLKVTGSLHAKIATIPHGLNPRFTQPPKPQRAIGDYDASNPYRVLYVSIIDQYKHQWHVVEAIAALRERGFPVVLHLIGPAYAPALKRLNRAIARHEGAKSWIYYHGSIPFDELHFYYARADLGLFASSCENMPNILLETMASGLPVACSNRGPMPEVLAAAGIYFDPESPEDIACAVQKLIESPDLRNALSQEGYCHAQQYSWKCCADKTFKFLIETLE
ncbi:MAG: glycosyltransferase family 4 protein [Burkholderiales bacterium]|nr:glycosyltransferase family 4 protein [Burkholderiales bacterium]